ncbi:LysR family transcriptional regulator [Pseudomonas sp. FW215-R2]|uniref:LysR family transcriptional regulator n=1 Tax=unclassified Pseudomonas TaxID=196821 RepID=UPI000C88958E|nr:MULTISPECIES: LysR family transcriptional regulator [unclassified Pseudomonas]PMW98967.1 LysR family transcriptional regulator [Pseudomonas sp. FW215-R2]PMX06471.1 LysR family transcriptional regulator [Pseudomonas sp. FW215-L1]PMX24492.1 LysR family transcriptional regulator [Pseudomonas sp. FW215-E1]PNA24351.1 LysR family transcriptional regulator [Pseudomonas sp. FW215-R4]
MDWDDLKVFVFVAKSNNVTEAGISLKVSASTVSRKIAALEESLGTVLFSKKTNGYFLTEAGRTLLPLALETEERFKLMERQMSQPGDRMAGQVRIDCPELMGTHLIIPGLAAFRDQHPEISFDFINSAVSSKLTQSHSDIIVRLRRPDNGNFTMRRVGTLMQGLFCSQGYAATHGLPTEPGDLKDHNLIGWTEEMAYMPLAQWLSEVSGDQKLWMRVSNLNAQLKAVEANLGIAALPAYVGHQSGLLQVLPDRPSRTSDIWLLRNQATQGVSRVDRVVEYLTELFHSKTAEIH